MSYVKVPSSSSKFAPTGKTVGKKKKTRRKPQWDDTVNDLSVHKASVDELNRRKIVSKSNNLDLVKAELMRKQISKACKKNKSHGYARPKRSNAFLREVLQDENDISDVLVKSDKMMAVVKDIFGDNPGKFRGLPNVTTAPEGTVSPDRKLPNGSSYTHLSKLDALSQTVMDQTALNDLSESCSDDETSIDGDTYKPSMDMERFRRLLKKAEVEEEKHKGKKQLSQSMAERALQKTLDQITKNTEDSWLARDGAVTPDSPERASQPDGAINDTGKIQRTKVCRDDKLNTVQAAKNPLTVNNLQEVMENLQKSLADYELQTGRAPASAASVEIHQQNTFSSYTTCLITSVTKLVTYLKESELKLREECAVNEHLSQHVQHLKTLLDSLTSDIIYQREEFAKLQSEFFYFKSNIEIQIHTLKQTLTAHGIEVPPVLPLPRPTFQMSSVTPANLPVYSREVISGSLDMHRNNSVMRGQSESQMQPGEQSQGYSTGTREHGSASGIDAARLLSPPKQTDSPRHNAGSAGQQGLGVEQGMISTRSLTMKDKAALQHSMKNMIDQQVQQRHSQQQLSEGRPQNASLETQLAQQYPDVQHSWTEQQYSNVQSRVPQQQGQLPQNREIGEQALQPSMAASSQHQMTNHLRPGSPMEKTGMEKAHAPDAEMVQLERELAELNRQHQEAQSKLEQIYKCHGVPTEADPTSGGQNINRPSQVPKPSYRRSVSPAISPITAASEQSLQLQATTKELSGRVITVSLPRADVLDSATISPVGEPPAKTSGRPAPPAGVPAQHGDRKAMPVNGTKASWFALSSHVGRS